MHRKERQELLKELDQRKGPDLYAKCAEAIRDLQEKLDNANEASMERENWQ